MILLTYQKKNGEIIERKVKNRPPYKVGEETSMGWILLDIKFYYKGKYYAMPEYNRLIDKAYKKHKKQTAIKNQITMIYKHLAYSLSVLILFKLFENTVIYNFAQLI